MRIQNRYFMRACSKHGLSTSEVSDPENIAPRKTVPTLQNTECWRGTGHLGFSMSCFAFAFAFVVVVVCMYEVDF